MAFAICFFWKYCELHNNYANRFSGKELPGVDATEVLHDVKTIELFQIERFHLFMTDLLREIGNDLGEQAEEDIVALQTGSEYVTEDCISTFDLQKIMDTHDSLGSHR